MSDHMRSVGRRAREELLNTENVAYASLVCWLVADVALRNSEASVPRVAVFGIWLAAFAFPWLLWAASRAHVRRTASPTSSR
jgi:hypothetical protein